jgi:hypothetical protein
MPKSVLFIFIKEDVAAREIAVEDVCQLEQSLMP